MSDASKTFTNAQLLGFSEALAALDGVKGEAYNFDGDTIWLIASNQAVVADKLKGFELARKQLAAKHKVTDRMVITVENAPQLAQFMEEIDALREKTVAADGVVALSKKALNVGSDKKKGQNQIPPSALAKLYLILEE